MSHASPHRMIRARNDIPYRNHHYHRGSSVGIIYMSGLSVLFKNRLLLHCFCFLFFQILFWIDSFFFMHLLNDQLTDKSACLHIYIYMYMAWHDLRQLHESVPLNDFQLKFLLSKINCWKLFSLCVWQHQLCCVVSRWCWCTVNSSVLQSSSSIVCQETLWSV